MEIRSATTEDIPALMQLVRRVVPAMRAAGNLQWGDDYPNAEVFLRDIEMAQLWVATVDGTLAGVIAATTGASPEYAEANCDLDEPAIEVHRLAVDPAFRGGGIAVALLMKAEQVARAKNIAVIRTDTNSENQATQKLFPRLGYEYVGEISLTARPGLRFLCYEKRLQAPA